MTNKNNNSNSNNNSLVEFTSIFVAMIIIFIIWAKYPSYMQDMDKSVNEEKTQIIIPFKAPQPASDLKQETRFEKIGEKYGAYGDSYGSLNTLFSGLAFAILIISLFMQRKELQAQREELEAQRNEISESNKIAEGQRLITEQQASLIKQQIKDNRVQNFYNTLFKYLEEKQRRILLLRSTRSSEISGEYVFKRFISIFTSRLSENINKVDDFCKFEKSKIHEEVINAFEIAKSSSRDAISNNQIFEYSSFILEYIEKYEYLDISDEAINIFISYQSLDEMYCMFLYALNNSKLLNYINKYSLLRKIFNIEDEYLATIVFEVLSAKAFNP